MCTLLKLTISHVSEILIFSKMFHLFSKHKTIFDKSKILRVLIRTANRCRRLTKTKHRFDDAILISFLIIYYYLSFCGRTKTAQQYCVH